MYKHLLRTRIAREIVCEFLPPAGWRPGKAESAEKVVIFADGMPGMPGNEEVVRFFSDNGWWAFFPRYRGTWESGGQFLKVEPTEDIRLVLDWVTSGKPFHDIWANDEFVVKNPKVLVIGSSFGGPAALFLSQDPRVSLSVALSGVVDWQDESPDEPLDWLYDFTKNAFGEGYRVAKRDWNKLNNGHFYNPIARSDEIIGEKCLLIHARDDRSVCFPKVEQFAEKIGAKTKFYQRGGHLSLSILRKPQCFKAIMRLFSILTQTERKAHPKWRMPDLHST